MKRRTLVGGASRLLPPQPPPPAPPRPAGSA